MKLDLPIHKQTRPYTCLPACIKIVLSFLSIEVAEVDAIRQLLSDTSLPSNDQRPITIRKARWSPVVWGAQPAYFPEWLPEDGPAT